MVEAVFPQKKQELNVFVKKALMGKIVKLIAEVIE